MKLSFRLPVSDVAIDVAGTVVWAGEKRQGIQFTEVSAQNLEAIREFVAEVEE